MLKKILDRVSRWRRDPHARAFARHNRKVFGGQDQAADVRKVLLEVNAMHSAHIAYSYLGNVLAARAGGRIDGYLVAPRRTWLQKIGAALDRVFEARELGIYTSFGARDFVSPQLTPPQRAAADTLFAQVTALLHSTRDVEDLTIDGVWIGDLVYDSYLMACRKPTIVLDAPDFQASLRNSLELFVFWNELMTPDSISAINISHCVYNQAIPLRIGVRKGIAVFQANLTHLYRLNEQNLFAYNDFFYFRERFAMLPAEVRAAGLAEAERRIRRRFAGEVGVDMSYSTKSAYGAFKPQRLIAESPRKKILIATHCFFDSPHSYGKNLFPDFHEWIDFLGQITLETDYDWYIKTHPDFLPGTMEIISNFIRKYPRIKLLPSDASHHQIIAEGIDLALTVYGTIGFEYAALGVPVINASLNNPHIAYDFNVHPKSVEQYRALLLDLDRFHLEIDKSQVYEYYFMARIFNTQNLFFDSYDNVIEQQGGYAAQFSPSIYQRWMEQWSPEKHRAILSAIGSFIDSGDFRMDYRHFGREFDIQSIEVQA